MATTARPAPPYQLIAGDRYNLTLGVVAAFVLAACKQIKGLPSIVQWNLTAYTNWNLCFIALRVALRQQQWDPFLLTNSIGILLSFRTAFCQGLDDNMRKKIHRLGLPLNRPVFLLLDHICHTVPPAVLLASLVQRQQRVSRMNSVYALVLSTWFAFRQSAGLDASGVYVPHPWKRAWLAIFVGVLATPPLVGALIDRKARHVVLYAGLLLAPYLSARLDPTLRQTYNFECRLSEAQADRKEAEVAAERKRAATRQRGGNTSRNGGASAGAGAGGATVPMPRSASEAPLRRCESGESS